MSKKHVLVTGGAGFIGSHLCKELVSRGYRVTCLDNFSTGYRENLAHLPEVEIIEADANEAATWQELQRFSFDTVYHYAATVGVLKTEENPDEVLRDVHGLLHLAEFARAGYAKKIVFASSSEVYGDSAHLPYAEASPAIAWSPYTVVKAFGEHLLQTLWHVNGIPTVSLRLFNVYGPRQRGNGYGFVTACFINQVLAGESPTVFGNGAQTRDFVFIRDNVRAAIIAAEQIKAHGEVVNIGTGRETSVLQLAEIIIASVNSPQLITPVFLPKRTIEIQRRCADVAKMQKLLATSCEVTLVQGLRATIASLAKSKAPASQVVSAVA